MMAAELDETIRSVLGDIGDAAGLPTGFDDVKPLPVESPRTPRPLIVGVGGVIAIVGLLAALTLRPSNTEPRRPQPPASPSAVSVAPPNSPEPSVPATVTTPTLQTVELAAESTTALPAAPIAGRVAPAAVWTGTEMIVWGGSELLEPSGEASLHDGAAFDLAEGRWRTLAPAPLQGRSYPASVWTGTEMIVWGGSNGGTTVGDGAAYDPATDQWRLLPAAPIDSMMKPSALWTGTEMLILGGLRSLDGASAFSVREAAAYNPIADSWRRLGDLPADPMVPYPQAVWTGEVVLTSLQSTSLQSTSAAPPNPTDAMGTQLASYDPTIDQWKLVGSDTTSPILVSISGDDLDGRAILAMPFEPDKPITLLDTDGNTIAQLAGRPADVAGSGNCAQAVWVSNEALCWMGGPKGWAFNPTTQIWRSFDAGDLAFRVDGTILTTGDTMLTWGGFISGVPNTEAADGILYRAAR
jgi:hypothetical protein